MGLFREVAPEKENNEKTKSRKRRLDKDVDAATSLQNQPKRRNSKKSMGVGNIIRDVLDNSQVETRKQERHLDCGDSSLQDNSPKDVFSDTEPHIESNEDSAGKPENEDLLGRASEQLMRESLDKSDQSNQLSQLWTPCNCPSFCWKTPTAEEAEPSLFFTEKHSNPLLDENEDYQSSDNPPPDSKSSISSEEEEEEEEEEVETNMLESVCHLCNKLFRSPNRLATQKSLQIHLESEHGAVAQDTNEDEAGIESLSNFGCDFSLQQVELTADDAKEETEIVIEYESLIQDRGPANLAEEGSLKKLMTDSDQLKKLYKTD